VFVEDGVYGESGLSSTTFKLIRRWNMNKQ
jgi:hypothetical protein